MPPRPPLLLPPARLSDKNGMRNHRTPRVSVLIPNFNNGRGSSIDGRRDFIADLLRSLEETLHDDPTPFEVIVLDDGSTDDSLVTLRNWSRRCWPDRRPFLELIEAEHCGVLAKTANIMSRRARGEFLARLDGDTICLTRHWVSRLCEVFDRGGERLGVVGPKQLRPDGRIHAYGDFVLHPNGYTHVAGGLERHAVQHVMEVDHVMGCFYCCRKAVFDELGGYDENFLRGQTIDFGLRARLHGWNCIAVPHIEYIHAHGLRQNRPTKADSIEGIQSTLQFFEKKWGFNRLAPDLDVVRQRYAGTPLLWNRTWFAPDGSIPGIAREPFAVETSTWLRYAREPALQQQVNFRVGVTLEVIRQTFRPALTVQLGAGDALALHLLAGQGLACAGFEPQAPAVEFARQCMAKQKYPAAAPRLEAHADLRRVPVPDGQAELVLLFDQLDRDPNPVTLLREARRLLAPGKLLLIVSQRPSAAPDDPSDPTMIREEPRHRRLMWHELMNIVRASDGWSLISPAKDDPSRDMVVLLQRLPDVAAAPVVNTTPNVTAAIARVA